MEKSKWMTILIEFSKITLQDTKQSYFEFVVYYPALKYTTISGVIKTKTSDLVAFIGGLAGLFIGASFLSLIEVIEMSVHIISIVATKNIQQNV